jgi:cytochrome c biogenesis protein CcmG, thiol:disulfide interchange protein DsbE
MATRDDIHLPRWIDDRLAVLNPPDGWTPDEARGVTRLREHRANGVRRRRRWTWMAVAAGTILLLVVPTPTVRGFAHACSEFVRRTISGADATHATEAVQRSLLSARELRDVSGRVFSVSDYRGKVVLLTYWSTSCRQCQSEMNWFTEFQRIFGDQRFAVVGVAVDQGGSDAVSRFLADRPVNYRIVLGDREVARLDAATSIPTTFILDRSGRIAVRHVGYCSKREFESDIRAVLAEP